mmetsp:Transcript_41304/g.129884  ORF Transcript_41304/g.129884 Transcript_41304/m.129884 type:complete len:255 (+) Transcript_41304:1314-2078(+)
MSCATMTSAMSTATRLTNSRLSTSCISTTTWPARFSIPFSDRTCLTILESDSSGEILSEASIMILLAESTPTFNRSYCTKGFPLRKITSVPIRFNAFSRLSIADSNVSSKSFLSCSARTTITPPPSLSFANAICWIIGRLLSFHPSIKVCPHSITLLLPFFRLSTCSPIDSEMIPIINAKTNIPPIVTQKAIILSRVPSVSAWVPGSATYVHDFQRVTDMSSPVDMSKMNPPSTIRTNVTISSNTGFANSLFVK